MTAPAPAHGLPGPGPRRRQRTRPLMATVAAVGMLAGVVAFPRDAATLQVFSENGWSTSATPRVQVARRGQTITIDVTVASDVSRHALVDLEVNDPSGRKVHQDFWDAQTFSRGVSKTYSTTWQVPAGEQLGQHVVRVGIFRVGWGVLYHWNHVAAAFDVQSSAPPPTTSSAPTTTRPPTTTVAPTTTRPPSTVPPAPPATVAPTTTPTTSPPSPPGPVQFRADFATAADFDARFDHGFSGLDPSTFPDYVPHIDSWNGDHNMACEGPTTLRTIHVDNKDDFFWWCAPGGDPAKGHVMVGVNTTGYNIAWFSPSQYFTNVSRVCWDQNLTELGGGKWMQVVLAARADVERVQAQLGHLDLGFTGPGFQVDGGPTTGVHPTAASGGAKMFRGGFGYWRGADFTTEMPGGQVTTDKATRYRHCMIDNGNGTITLTQQRPDGVHSHTGPGTMPDGDVRVVWQDDNYDVPKRDNYDPNNLTWHIDNIEIS